MSDYYWIGGASTAAQEDHFTPANVEISDVFTLTATGEDGSTVAISFTATAATVANVTAGLAAAWNASTSALCTGITATDMTTYLKLVADSAGVPFYVASSTTDGGGTNTQTLTRSAVTASRGPNDWNTAANWSGEAVPGSDNITIDGRSASAILYGMDQSAVTPANLYIDHSNGYQIGTTTAKLRFAGVSGLLRIGAPAGDGSTGSGAPLVNLSIGGSWTAKIENSRSQGLSGLPPVNLAGGTGSIYQSGGILGVGKASPGDTGTLAVAQVTSGSLYVGSSIVWSGTITNLGGNVKTECGGSGTTLSQSGGTTTTLGTSKVANIAATGGKLIINNRPSSGNFVDQLSLLPAPATPQGPTLDATGDQRTPASYFAGTFTWGAGTLTPAASGQFTYGSLLLSWGTGKKLALQQG